MIGITGYDLFSLLDFVFLYEVWMLLLLLLLLHATVVEAGICMGRTRDDISICRFRRQVGCFV